MKRLFLVRHGSTDANDRKAFLGRQDPPLNERGEHQARAVATKLPPLRWAGVWTSSLQRAARTAELAGYDATSDDRLVEFDFGDIEGLTFSELDQDHAALLFEFDSYEAPNGETVNQLRERLASFIGDLDDGDHLVFTHGGVIRALLRETHTDMRVDPGDIVVIEVD